MIEALCKSEPHASGFERPNRLLQGFLKTLSEGHDLADRMHLDAQPVFGVFEFIEHPTGRSDGHIIKLRDVFLQTSFSPMGDFIQ